MMRQSNSDSDSRPAPAAVFLCPCAAAACGAAVNEVSSKKIISARVMMMMPAARHTSPRGRCEVGRYRQLRTWDTSRIRCSRHGLWSRSSVVVVVVTAAAGPCVRNFGRS